MSESKEPEPEWEELDGVTVDEDGNPQVEMESLEKGGTSGNDDSEK